MERNLDQSTVAKRSGENRPTEEHEQMARALLGAMQKMMQESNTTSGEVVGDDGGKVRVRFADADEPREIGFPRVRGQRYNKGDRVALHRLRGGEWFLGGAVSTKAGLDPAVANEDLHTDAVDGRALKAGSVARGHIQGKAVGTQELDDSAVETGKIHDDAVTSPKIKDGAVTDDKLDKNYADQNHGAHHSETTIKGWIDDAIDQHLDRKH